MACNDNNDSTSGTRFQPKAVDVKVTDQSTGCADTLATSTRAEAAFEY